MTKLIVNNKKKKGHTPVVDGNADDEGRNAEDIEEN